MKYRIEWIVPFGTNGHGEWTDDERTAYAWADKLNKRYPRILYYVARLPDDSDGVKETNYFDPEVKKAAIEKGRSKSWTETAQQAPLPKPTRERGVSID
jgi:hypothetical protein